MGSVDAWVRYWSGRGPDRVAVTAGRASWTWGELADRAVRRAAGLAERGVRSGDRVGVACDPLGLVEGLVGCAERGAIAAPGERDAAGPSPDVVSRSRAERTAAAAGTGPAFDAPLLDLPGGTLTHANVEAVAIAGLTANGLVPTDRVAIAGPAAAPTAIGALLAAMHAGARVDYLGAPEDDPAFDEHGPTLLVAGPPGWVGDRPERAAAAGTLRAVVVPAPAPDRLRRAFAGPPAHRIVEVLGPAAACGLSMQRPVGAPDGELVPLLGQRARVVDRDGAPVAAGVPGCLEVAGSAVPGGWVRTEHEARREETGRFRILGPVGAP